MVVPIETFPLLLIRIHPAADPQGVIERFPVFIDPAVKVRIKSFAATIGLFAPAPAFPGTTLTLLVPFEKTAPSLAVAVVTLNLSLLGLPQIPTFPVLSITRLFGDPATHIQRVFPAE